MMIDRKSVGQQAKEKIADFFDRHVQYFLVVWLEGSMIKDDDPYYEEVKKNGEATVRLIRDSIFDNKVAIIQNLMQKIANERLNANVNISEFLYNINIGRNVVIDALINKASFTEEEQIYAILCINEVFDNYGYYAVKAYTELKDKIIHQKNLFIQEMHRDRLTILGQISASFAHEFRNPLTAVKGFIQLIEKENRHLENTKTYFSIINREIENLQEKINQFLYFSKMSGADEEMKTFNLENAIRQIVDLMYPRVIEEQLLIVDEIESNITLFGVEEQIKQVILNILNNAVDALHEKNLNRKVIRITAKTNNNCVSLVISNNGGKIPDPIIENIFEPFVSTKKLGTGIGLSVCKEIIENHYGSIQVESTEKQTSFIICFPIHKKESH